jgi:hypothetical protein
MVLQNQLSHKVAKLRLPDYATITYEGGLGSQILSHLRMLNLKSKGKKIWVDLEYFTNPKNLEIPGLSRWDWELKDFEIKLESLQQLKRSSIDRLFHKIFWRKPSEMELLCYHLNSSYLKISDEIRDQFPMDLKSLNSIHSDLNIIDQKYYVVHIRQGDYLNVASRVISIGEIRSALSFVKEQITQNLFFISDSPLSPELNDLIQEMNQNKSFRAEFMKTDKLTPVALHSFIRSANGLIASNSTFSFTAGILSKGMDFFLFPNSFHSTSRDSSSLLFSQESDWCLVANPN